jgi:hypothetical protein
MSTFSEEQFNQIEQILKKLDLLDVIAEDIKSIRQTNREIAEILNIKSFEHCEKIQENAVEADERKNIEHVRGNNESKVQGDDKSVEKHFDNKSGENDQKRIDQKATNVIVKFRRVKSKRRRRLSTSPNACLKVIPKSTCKAFLVKLKSAPSRVFMRRKKYKWDDGG